MNTFLTTLVLATMAIAGANAQACPIIISRAQWGARDAAWLEIPPALNVVVHHTAGVACRNLNTCSAEMRAIQNRHMDKNGWQDIGYNFCIGGDGLIYEGRGWQAMGAHTPGFNDQSLGICFLGDFTSVLPTVAARNNAQSLIRCGVASGRIDNDYWLNGHGVVDAVTCPGRALLEELTTWNHGRTWIENRPGQNQKLPAQQIKIRKISQDLRENAHMASPPLLGTGDNQMQR